MATITIDIVTSENENQTNTDADRDAKLNSKLNEYFHILQEALGVCNELYKLDSILEDHMSLTKKYLWLIESDSWSSAPSDLSAAFDWLSEKLLRRIIQISAQIDARDPLCSYFVRFFREFTLIFAIDYELIKTNVIILIYLIYLLFVLFAFLEN
jgi:hypothetical protein